MNPSSATGPIPRRRAHGISAALLIASFWLPSMTVSANQNPIKEAAMNQPMQLQSSYPVVVTGKLKESREFYARWFGFETVFEASWFIYLQAGGGQPWGLAFMSPDHPSKPPGPEAFNGKGVFLTFQVEDASAEFARLKAAGVRIAYPIKDEPWGQRRFGIFDPAGMWLDVVEQIAPATGFWDPYMKP
jgi:catechol 2,3-dioxygenase-like lactoylglutathione lyase family enzyme